MIVSYYRRMHILLDGKRVLFQGKQNHLCSYSCVRMGINNRWCYLERKNLTSIFLRTLKAIYFVPFLSSRRDCNACRQLVTRPPKPAPTTPTVNFAAAHTSTFYVDVVFEGYDSKFFKWIERTVCTFCWHLVPDSSLYSLWIDAHREVQKTFYFLHFHTSVQVNWPPDKVCTWQDQPSSLHNASHSGFPKVAAKGIQLEYLQPIVSPRYM